MSTHTNFSLFALCAKEVISATMTTLRFLLLSSVFTSIFAQLTVVSDCLEVQNLEFIWVDDRLIFDDAQIACSELDPPAALASVPNAVTQNFISDFLIVASETRGQPLFGLRRAPASSLPDGTDLRDPNLFSFLDGTPIEQLSNGQFPWGVDRPNNSGGGEQACGK